LPENGPLGGGFKNAPPQLVDAATVRMGSLSSGGSLSFGSVQRFGIVVDVEDVVVVVLVVLVVVVVEPRTVVVVTPPQWLASMVQSGRQTRKPPAAEPPGQVAPQKSVPSHCSVPLQTPSPHAGGLLVVVVVLVVLVVVVGGGTAHPPSASQASQQLDMSPTHALPPRGARHFAALGLTLHFVLPFAAVRQQVTAPGRPQVDLAAHRSAPEAQLAGSVPSATAAFTTAATQRR
jgi:hypothetical protein